MSHKKEIAEDKLKEKYSQHQVKTNIRLTGAVKNEFYSDLKKTGYSENKLHLSIIKFYYENHPSPHTY